MQCADFFIHSFLDRLLVASKNQHDMTFQLALVVLFYVSTSVLWLHNMLLFVYVDWDRFFQ